MEVEGSSRKTKNETCEVRTVLILIRAYIVNYHKMKKSILLKQLQAFLFSRSI
jgi:hypothetical protein